MGALTEFDPDEARLQLTERAFETLISVHRGGTARPARDTADLYRIGVLTESGVHARLRDALSAVVTRRSEFSLWISDPRVIDVQHAWALGGTAGWQITTPMGVDFRAVSTELLPDLIADAVQLGPRDGLGSTAAQAALNEAAAAGASPQAAAKSAGAVVRVRPRVFDAILAGSETNRQDAAAMIANRSPAELDVISAHLRAKRWRSWHAEMLWFDSQRARHGAGVIAVDTPAAVLIAHPVDAFSVDLIPMRPAEVWRRLLRLNPPPEQITPIPSDSVS
jgi:hypothetical protein